MTRAGLTLPYSLTQHKAYLDTCKTAQCQAPACPELAGCCLKLQLSCVTYEKSLIVNKRLSTAALPKDARCGQLTAPRAAAALL